VLERSVIAASLCRGAATCQQGHRVPDPAAQRRRYNSASHAKCSNSSCDIVPSSNAHPVRGRTAKCRTERAERSRSPNRATLRSRRGCRTRPWRRCTPWRGCCRRRCCSCWCSCSCSRGRGRRRSGRCCCGCRCSSSRCCRRG